jgi:predicted  nucleic acid-binding Zn-ribbon protein
VSKEAEDLATHVEICALRYQGIQDQVDTLKEKMDRVERDLKDLRADTAKGFNEIKTMLQSARDEKFKVMVGAASTVIVSLLGMLGYLITHLPK